ncbi:hypothetical protein ACFQDN_20590 [Pseudomonas asuensis]|uniref:hypothetical protein n=1 Tax=Pseudomonas asuensis TaxID=1825787 RepID=UPI0016634E7B|nr:hypothetical protein [Pseudomonas asuensis]
MSVTDIRAWAVGIGLPLVIINLQANTSIVSIAATIVMNVTITVERLSAAMDESVFNHRWQYADSSWRDNPLQVLTAV